MNTLFILLDGAEDHPNPELGGKKPLDAADIPFIRSNIKTKGKTTGKGYTHLFLNEFFTGKPPSLNRAVLEAMGLGMDVSNGRSAYRLSPAVLKDGMINWSYESHLFCDELTDAVMRNMYHIESHDPEIRFFINGRAVITMDCDDVPDLPGPPVPAPFVEVPGDLGKMVMSVAEEMGGITNYPWGCGKFTEQHPHFECLDNLKAFSNSPTSLGICASMGYEIELIEEFDDRFPAARKALDHGNVFLHIDEIDEYSHMKDYRKKIEILERTDRNLKEHFSDVERIVYFIDHGTSSITGEHLPLEVPFWSTFDTDISDNELVPLNQVIPRLML